MEIVSTIAMLQPASATCDCDVPFERWIDGGVLEFSSQAVTDSFFLDQIWTCFIVE